MGDKEIMLSQYDIDNCSKILLGEGDWFTAQLLRLIAKGDIYNRRLLSEVYPDEVALVNKCQGVEMSSHE